MHGRKLHIIYMTSIVSMLDDLPNAVISIRKNTQIHSTSQPSPSFSNDKAQNLHPPSKNLDIITIMAIISTKFPVVSAIIQL